MIDGLRFAHSLSRLGENPNMSEAIARFAAFLQLSDVILARAEREDFGGVRQDLIGSVRHYTFEIW